MYKPGISFLHHLLSWSWICGHTISLKMWHCLCKLLKTLIYLDMILVKLKKCFSFLHAMKSLLWTQYWKYIRCTFFWSLSMDAFRTFPHLFKMHVGELLSTVHSVLLVNSFVQPSPHVGSSSQQKLFFFIFLLPECVLKQEWQRLDVSYWRVKIVFDLIYK